MKGGIKIIRWIMLISLPLLFQVHQQFLLFSTSYQINQKQHSVGQKTETMRRLKFEVDQLKAPRLLEDQLKRLNLELSLPKEINVVKLPTEVERYPLTVKAMPREDWTLQFMNWVGRWVDVAQAKVESE